MVLVNPGEFDQDVNGVFHSMDVIKVLTLFMEPWVEL